MISVGVDPAGKPVGEVFRPAVPTVPKQFKRGSR